MCSLKAGRLLPVLLPHEKRRRERLETGTCPFALHGSAAVRMMSCQQVVERERKREEGHAREGSPASQGTWVEKRVQVPLVTPW